MVIGVYIISTYVIDSFHVKVYIYKCRHVCYKHLQMVVSTYLELGSTLVDSRLFTHALESLSLTHVIYISNSHIISNNIRQGAQNTLVMSIHGI